MEWYVKRVVVLSFCSEMRRSVVSGIGFVEGRREGGDVAFGCIIFLVSGMGCLVMFVYP